MEQKYTIVTLCINVSGMRHIRYRRALCEVKLWWLVGASIHPDDDRDLSSFPRTVPSYDAPTDLSSQRPSSFRFYAQSRVLQLQLFMAVFTKNIIVIEI